uniref:Solute carrier family 39 member 2 n=1 Tax=Ovis aries TaxID=9940 RepID=A0AC11DRD1_SHEEP
MRFSRQEHWSGVPLPSPSAQSQSCTISSLPYFPQSSAVKKPPSTQETRVRSLGGEEPLEKEMAAHYGIFAWKIPWNLAGYGPEDRKQLGMTEHKRSTLCHLTTAFCSHQMEYPYGELVISLGFFLVFLLESLALQCCPGTAETPKVQEQELGTAHELEPHSHGLLPSPSRGPFRALILLLSLSFHSVFEGLAVGLQLTVASTVQLCLAVLAHKGIVVFGVGLRLVQVGTESRWAVLSILSLALMSPLGLAIGLAVPQGDSKAGQGLAQALLEGMAAGTFLYVTFLEILPRELASPEAPLAKWSCVAAGFAFMAVIALWA